MLERYTLIKAIHKVTSEPNNSFSIRGLASEIGISPRSAKIALDYMLNKGIVTLKVIGRTYQYRTNLESPLCRQWKILFNLDILEDLKIVDTIKNNLNSLYSLLLYGSFARGTNDKHSDIDLLALTHKPEKLSIPAEKLGPKFNITVLSLKEWKEKAVKDRVFYDHIIFDSIVLYGERPVVL